MSFLQTRYFTGKNKDSLVEKVNTFLRKLPLSQWTQVVFLPAEVHPAIDSDYQVYYSAYIIYEEKPHENQS